jgi:hypothetical protein
MEGAVAKLAHSCHSGRADSHFVEMPIPALNADGLLPVGVFDCTLAEVQGRFGAFSGTDRRVRLFARLEELALALRSSGLFEAVIIDGSFVTAKVVPNDIDVIAVLRSGHNFEEELSVSQYWLVSRPLLRRRYGFDAFVAESGSMLYKKYVEFFSRVRASPGARKGLLRVVL